MTAPNDIATSVLSSDEAVILTMLAEGATYQAISRRLGVSRSALSMRVSRLYERRGFRNAPHAVAVAVRRGWIA